MNEKLGDGFLLKLPFSIGNGRNFFIESDGKPSIELKLYKKIFTASSLSDNDSRNSELGLLGRASFHKSAEGPPGHAHGGALAYVLDEAMGGTAWAFGYPVVAASLSFSFKSMSPLDEVFEIETKIHKIDFSLLISGVVRRLNGQLLVEANSEFVILRKSKIDKLMSAIGPLDKNFDIDSLHWADEKSTKNDNEG